MTFYEAGMRTLTSAVKEQDKMTPSQFGHRAETTKKTASATQCRRIAPSPPIAEARNRAHTSHGTQQVRIFKCTFSEMCVLSYVMSFAMCSGCERVQMRTINSFNSDRRRIDVEKREGRWLKSCALSLKHW